MSNKIGKPIQSYINFIMKVNRAVPPEGKVAYYRSDGTGRDTYIKQHNGGLLSKDRLHSLCLLKAPKQRNLSFGKAQYNRHPTSYKTGGSNKFPHYISDGSGRDYYVKNNEGGNNRPFNWRDQTDFLFKSTLRSHAPWANANPQNQDVFRKSQMKSTMKEESFRKTFAPVQRMLDSRLSEPKRALVPPPVHTYYGQGFTAASKTQRLLENQTRNNKSHSFKQQISESRF